MGQYDRTICPLMQKTCFGITCMWFSEDRCAVSDFAAINSLSVSIDELATEVQQLRETTESLQETIKTTEFTN